MMAPCLTTAVPAKENNNSMEFAYDDDSTCASLAIADDGTCQKHPYITLCDPSKGIINQSCPECDEELQTQRKTLKGKRRELEKQLQDLNRDDDGDNKPEIFHDDSEEVSEEHKSRTAAFAGFSFLENNHMSTNNNNLFMKNQVTVIQQMSDWMLQQKENEITLLRSQVENFRKELLQKEVENALLKEKLKLKDERLEQEIKLRELWKENTPPAREKDQEAKDSRKIHIQELIVQYGPANSKKDGSAVEEEKIVDPKEIEAATNLVTQEALSKAVVAAKEMKGSPKDEYVPKKTSPEATPTAEQNKTKHDDPSSSLQEIRFDPAYSEKRKPIQRPHKEEEEQVKDTQKGRRAKDVGIYNLSTLKSPKLSIIEPSVQNSEDTSKTQQTKNTYSKDDKKDAYLTIHREYNVGHVDDESEDKEELELNPSTFLQNSPTSQHIISRSLQVPVLESLKKPAPHQNRKTAADIALSPEMTGLPSKDALNRKRSNLPPGIPEEIDPDDCPSLNNDEITLPTIMDTEDQTYDDNITCATSTCCEDRLKVVDKKLTDPYGDKGVYTGVVLRSTMMPHGSGRMVYDDDGRSYEGEWRHGRWHGYGSAAFPNGDSYDGDYRFDQRHGKGKYCWKDGRVYDGDFREDRRQGKGFFRWPDGATYEGDFQKGKRHGKGKYNFVGGGYYEGGWSDGRYEGYGECIWKDGRSYKGEWCAGLAHGKGVETFPDGQVRHDGQWHEDEPVC